MQTEIIFSGFGGQGVLFTGQLLSYAAADGGKYVTWFPSYGPEMRGGTANCTVIIADEEIGSPMVRNPHCAIVMNLPSLDKYEPLIVPDGILVVNTSMTNREVVRKDLNVISVKANEIAESLGDIRMTNMILLGALLERNPIVTLDAVKKALEEHLLKGKKQLLAHNFKALDTGARSAKN